MPAMTHREAFVVSKFRILASAAEMKTMARTCVNAFSGWMKTHWLWHGTKSPTYALLTRSDRHSGMPCHVFGGCSSSFLRSRNLRTTATTASPA